MKFIINDLKPTEFIDLSKKVGWGVNRNYDMRKVEKALMDTSWTIVVRDNHLNPIGCARVFSDDFLMSFIPDIFVDPKFQRQGIGRRMMKEIINKFGHTRIFFGAQKDAENFFKSLGFETSLQSYAGTFKDNPFYS
jgi:GNAT superfamily N-acetyltransferase